MKPGVALITGCSSGIGRELAQQLVQQGWQVYAGARRPETLEAIASQQLLPVQLDVNSTEQVAQCVGRIETEVGRLDLLVNNAGYGAMGPVIEMPLAELRQQFETNVFAPLGLAQAALPLLLQSDAPLVVNIGSISGIVTTPFSGAYCATKAALHSLSDALRMELAPLGVQVMTIQPGAIQSEFGNNAERSLAATLPADSLYQPVRAFIDARARASQQNGTPTREFVQDLAKAIDQQPPVRRLGRGSTSLPLLKRLLPVRWLDRLLSRRFGLNRPLVP